MRPLLLVEINEVSWRLIEMYRQRPEFPHLNQILREAKHYKTMAVDDGELSPWITWPTFHRGIKDHQIHYLGQDPKTYKGTPIWEEVRKRNGNLGIFGSLQSWPPQNPGENGFFVPDTFSQDESCYPESLRPIQAFNLDQVRENGRVIQGGLLSTLKKSGIVFTLLENGLRWKSIFSLAKQIISEFFNPQKKSRRSTFQTIIFWDCFRKLYNPENPPTFSTFFTNHIASLQHRYWHHVFPEDFGKQEKNLDAMDHAFSVLDEICEELLSYRKRNPQLTIALANSMSQGAISRPEHHGTELAVKNTKRLFTAIGLKESEFEPLLAMAPQIAVKVPGSENQRLALENLKKVRSESGVAIFIPTLVGETISVTTKTPPKKDCETEVVFFGDSKMQMSDFGVVPLKVDAGTAYHIPEGFLLVCGNGLKNVNPESPIPATKVKELLLEMMEAR